MRSIEIRPARHDEIRSVAELWVHTFPGDRSLAERIAVLESAGLHGGIETVLVAEESGKLAAALKAPRMTLHMGGVAMPMMGLAAVGVAPWARRRGIAGALCGAALERSRDRGDVVSALYPFRPEFYGRLGWGLAGELHSYRFAPERLPERGDPEVRLATPDDLAGVRACYARVARDSNGLLERDDSLWSKQLDLPNAHVFVVGGDPIEGYLVARYGRSAATDQRPLHVRELVASTGDAYERLLAWIPRQRDLWRRIRYDASPDEHFGLRLSDPRPPGFGSARWLWAETSRILRGPMLRIIDVVAAFERRERWGSGEPIEFELVVDDAQLPANAGRWCVSFDGTRASLRRYDAAGSMGIPGERRDERTTPVATPSSGRLSLRVDPATLAQLYAGEIPVSAAARLGMAGVDGNASALDALFRPATSFRMLDEF